MNAKPEAIKLFSSGSSATKPTTFDIVGRADVDLIAEDWSTGQPLPATKIASLAHISAVNYTNRNKYTQTTQQEQCLRHALSQSLFGFLCGSTGRCRLEIQQTRFIFTYVVRDLTIYW